MVHSASDREFIVMIVSSRRSVSVHEASDANLLLILLFRRVPPRVVHTASDGEFIVVIVVLCLSASGAEPAPLLLLLLFHLVSL